jgi:outer membrane protein OmpU
MNKLRKIGLTALAGSMAAVSAQAGELSVTGSFNATYSSQSGDTGTTTADHAVGYGNDRDFGVSGSGELDNGFTFAGHTLLKDDMTVSSSALSLTMGSMGTLSTGFNFGGSNSSFDQETPRAYEEVDDGGAMSTSSNYIGNWDDNNSITYKAPAIALGDFSMQLMGSYSPKATGASAVDGGTVSSTVYGSGTSLGAIFTGMGVTAGIYGAERENVGPNTAGTDFVQDDFQGSAFINYAMGPVTVGYQKTYHDSGLAVASELAVTAKTAGTAGGIFEAETIAIAFNVNDNLSVSYAKTEDTYDSQDDGVGKGTAAILDVTSDFTSIQAAYSMGAMSIKAYRTETDNAAYATNGGSLTVNEIALGLSF